METLSLTDKYFTAVLISLNRSLVNTNGSSSERSIQCLKHQSRKSMGDGLLEHLSPPSLYTLPLNHHHPHHIHFPNHFTELLPPINRN
ncbi:hypothetical protein J6590_098123 [Homalodisca vitripennis]|nr:hypothetical protein J6590_098123 [Homalodisca vitripennis]